MNRYQLQKFVALCLFVFVFTQCKKDFSSAGSDAVSQTQSASGQEIALSKWGVVINCSAPSSSEAEDHTELNFMEPAQKVTLAGEYGVTYIRCGITKEKWDDSKDGFLYTYDQYTDKGFRILLNIIWKEPVKSKTGEMTPVPFVTNAGDKTGDYYKYVKDVVETLTSPEHKRPAGVVVENEETNKLYHVLDGGEKDYHKYIGMLNAVIEICKPKGIDVTNGGLTARALTFATHDWLNSFSHRKEEAKTYAYNSMPPSAYHTLYPPCPEGIYPIGKDNIAKQADMINYYIDHYKSMDMNYINVHWYEPVKMRYWDESRNNGTPWKAGVNKNEISEGALEGMVEYISKKASPKKVISNEIGQLTNSDCLTKKIMNKIDERPYGAFTVATWYDSDAGELYGAKALHNTYTNDPFYGLRNTGIMFREIIKNPSGNKSCSPL